MSISSTDITIIVYTQFYFKKKLIGLFLDLAFTDRYVLALYVVLNYLQKLFFETAFSCSLVGISLYTVQLIKWADYKVPL